MVSKAKIAESAAQTALRELGQANRQAARFWALRSLALAPDREDAWLILAALSNPHASLVYIKEALKINPGSLAARQGLWDVQRRLEKAGNGSSPAITARATPESLHQTEVEAQEESPDDSEPIHDSSAEKRDEPQPIFRRIKSLTRQDWRRVFLVAGLVLLAILILFLLFTNIGTVKAQTFASARRQRISLQQSPTPTILAGSQLEGGPFFVPISNQTSLSTSTSTPLILPPTPTSTPMIVPATPTPPGEKRIEVRLSQQHLYAYQGNQLIYSFTVSTGMRNSTRIGTFSILDKNPNAYSYLWGFYMPDWLGFYPVGGFENGFHALPVLPNGNMLWASELGTPVSYGCVVLAPVDAQLLYDWAEIGTRVEILQ